MLEFQWFPSEEEEEDMAKEVNMKMKKKITEFLRLRKTKKITRLHLECLIHSSLFLSNLNSTGERSHFAPITLKNGLKT